MDTRATAQPASIHGFPQKGELQMSTRGFVLGVVLVGLATCDPISAQQPQIPTLQVCNQTTATGRGLVKINSRVAAGQTGTFEVAIEMKCDPRDGYPAGTLQIRAISMTDSTIQGTAASIAFEQVTSTGKHTPTVYLNGRCRAEGVRGCRYWLMIADNRKADDRRGTPDIVSFLIFNGEGVRVAYGTGPVIRGDITVTSN